MTNPVEPNPTPEDIAACLRVLRLLIERPSLCDSGDLGMVRDHAGRLLRAAKSQRNREVRQRDRDLLDASGIRGPEPETPLGERQLAQTRNCYVCKQPYARLHAFYDSLCPGCGDLNLAKRTQTADLTGQVALVTGGRVKIGYHIALKLLRAGACVLATTRFPRDAARRFASESDFAEWSARLEIHAIDLRDLVGVDCFGQELAQRLPRLDIVVNNAAQTVRRPPAFYRHLLEQEDAAFALATPALRTQLALLPGDSDGSYFPAGWLDRYEQQVDLRPSNSWAQELGEVAPLELIEVHAVNSFAPFLLLRRLEPLLFAEPARPRHVLNVSAVEGQFNGATKTGRHPHTNMAKAALNMITRTCAGPYAERGVYVNSVDTGWVSNEAPEPRAAQMASEGFREPLDVVDGAARVLDPVFVGHNTGRHESGKFWKDYRPVPW